MGRWEENLEQNISDKFDYTKPKRFCIRMTHLSNMKGSGGGASMDEIIKDRKEIGMVMETCCGCVNDCKQYWVPNLTVFKCLARETDPSKKRPLEVDEEEEEEESLTVSEADLG